MQVRLKATVEEAEHRAEHFEARATALQYVSNPCGLIHIVLYMYRPNQPCSLQGRARCVHTNRVAGTAQPVRSPWLKLTKGRCR